MARVFTVFDTAVLAYLISHVPITMFIDGQAVIPASYYPVQIGQLLSWYCDLFNDNLMSPSGRPMWFKSIVCVELTLQMAYFFVAIRAWLIGDNRIRIPTIIYGAHTATTLVPILGVFLTDPTFKSESQRWTIIAIYLPYLIMPLAMMWRASVNEVLFPLANASPQRTETVSETEAEASPKGPARSPRAISSRVTEAGSRASIRTELSVLARAFSEESAHAGGLVMKRGSQSGYGRSSSLNGNGAGLGTPVSSSRQRASATPR